jgi:hypothetical protein
MIHRHEGGAYGLVRFNPTGCGTRSYRHGPENQICKKQDVTPNVQFSYIQHVTEKGDGCGGA